MIFLARYWQPMLSAILMAVLCYFLHNWDVSRINKKHENRLLEQAANLNERCAKEKLITQEASNGYQKTIAAIAADRASLARRLRSYSACVPITNAPSGSNAGATGAGFSSQTGIPVEELVNDYAACDKYVAQVLGLQKFINDTWNLKGE